MNLLVDKNFPFLYQSIEIRGHNTYFLQPSSRSESARLIDSLSSESGLWELSRAVRSKQFTRLEKRSEFVLIHLTVMEDLGHESRTYRRLVVMNRHYRRTAI